MNGTYDFRLETSGKVFFYPCAGRDWEQPLTLFKETFDHFFFVDLAYQFNRIVPLNVPGLRPSGGPVHLQGPERSECQIIQSIPRPYRDIEPAWLHEEYVDSQAERRVRVTRRRGFGQYALDEIGDGSLGMFFHRGDSPGEGGSNTWYLANMKSRHSALGMLFEKIKRKLANPAYIASDGSNTVIRELEEASRGLLERTQGFTRFGLNWKRAAVLPFRSGSDTVVWEVNKI